MYKKELYIFFFKSRLVAHLKPSYQLLQLWWQLTASEQQGIKDPQVILISVVNANTLHYMI